MNGELQASSDIRQSGWFSAEDMDALPLTPGVSELAKRALEEAF